MIKIKKLQSGQSLIEMIFAIGFLLMVVSAILALTVSNITGQKESEFQISANNFAREGIEAVRNIRDSNWLAQKDWDEGLVGSDNEAIAEFNEDNNTWQLNFAYTDDRLYISSDEGISSHDNTGSPSSFSRHLILDNICQDENGREAINTEPPCGANERKIGIKVIAVVSWEEKGRTRQVTLEDLLYEWK